MKQWIDRRPEAPLRVDFAGGWLDVPEFAREGEYIVNCAISPTVSLQRWPYEKYSGMGGSGAWWLLNGKDGVAEELKRKSGWQDPAVIAETGLCVWHSGAAPKLEIKTRGDFLRGRMALYWTGKEHNTAELSCKERSYIGIASAGMTARQGVWMSDLSRIIQATNESYAIQLREGMDELPLPDSLKEGKCARKYCGSGWGGYALYIFQDPTLRDFICLGKNFIAIEPYIYAR